MIRAGKGMWMAVQSTLGAEVDVRRIGLWGTSFAGGHVLVIAANEGTNVSAVVSQVSKRFTAFCPQCPRVVSEKHTLAQ
jgi:dienelactone hydrolase